MDILKLSSFILKEVSFEMIVLELRYHIIYCIGVVICGMAYYQLLKSAYELISNCTTFLKSSLVSCMESMYLIITVHNVLDNKRKKMAIFCLNVRPFAGNHSISTLYM